MARDYIDHAIVYDTVHLGLLGPFSRITGQDPCRSLVKFFQSTEPSLEAVMA